MGINKKLAIAGAGALALGGVGFGISRLAKSLHGRKLRVKRDITGRRRHSSLTRLRNQIQRIKLRRLKIQENRKLFKEQLRG